jgi:ABC-type polysaccharide/polyol phosphate transport system ATPase subunit
MVSIRADDLSLAYRVYQPLTLAPPDRRLLAGGRLERRDKGGSVVALDRVSFSLAAGDRLGVVGQNGAGKTTLLKVLYGIYEPTGGSLSITGRRDALFNITLGFRPEATGRRNIKLRGLINGWTPKQIAERMDSIIAFSELGEFIDLPFKAYSQGMAARLAFSVATSLEPEILLMDEWIGAGDPAFQDKAQARMHDMASRAGIVVLASHNHSLLKRTCNKILVLERGRVKDFLSIQDWAAAA